MKNLLFLAGLVLVYPHFINAMKDTKMQNTKLQNPTSQARTRLAKVNGMVCGFCANNIEKKFKKQKSVESIKVDLESQLVTVVVKPNEELADEKIRELITASGFHVVSITDGTPGKKQEPGK